jgi:hypothetical protein
MQNPSKIGDSRLGWSSHPLPGRAEGVAASSWTTEARHVWLLRDSWNDLFLVQNEPLGQRWTLCGRIVQQAATAQGWQYDRHLTEVVKRL